MKATPGKDRPARPMKMMRKLTLLILPILFLMLMGLPGCSEPEAKVPPAPSLPAGLEATNPEPDRPDSVDEFVYGYSGLGQPLHAWRISGTGQQPATQAALPVLLCVFEIHGFEDAFYKDGQILVNTANKVVDYFVQHPDELGQYTLIVVPSANPDGLASGYTCNGPGRCQVSGGFDINMDFDYNFRVKTNPRNKTGSEPLFSPEGQALYSLVMQEQPQIIIDFHGWTGSTAGDDVLAGILAESLGIRHTAPDEIIFSGFFSGWAMSVSRAALVEYPNPFTGQGSWDGKSDQPYETDLDYANGTIEAIRRICQTQ